MHQRGEIAFLFAVAGKNVVFYENVAPFRAPFFYDDLAVFVLSHVSVLVAQRNLSARVAKQNSAAVVIVRIIVTEENVSATDIYIEALAVRAAVRKVTISRLVILHHYIGR